MDKKIYFEPETEVLEMMVSSNILAGSIGDVDDEGGDAKMDDNPSSDPSAF